MASALWVCLGVWDLRWLVERSLCVVAVFPALLSLLSASASFVSFPSFFFFF